MEKRLTVQKMATPVVVFAALTLLLIGQSDAQCMSPFMPGTCPPMLPVQPFINISTPSDYNKFCPNITYGYNCYNQFAQNCTSSDQMFDAFQQVLWIQRASWLLCNGAATSYNNNAVCISTVNRNSMMASPPPTPTTAGPCSAFTDPFGTNAVANKTNAAVCANWNQYLQCSTSGYITPCSTGAAQLVADYTAQIFGYQASKYGCAAYTVSGGGSGGSGGSGSGGSGGSGGATTPKASSAQRLGTGSFAVVFATACATLIGWSHFQA